VVNDVFLVRFAHGLAKCVLLRFVRWMRGYPSITFIVDVLLHSRPDFEIFLLFRIVGSLGELLASLPKGRVRFQFARRICPPGLIARAFNPLFRRVAKFDQSLCCVYSI